MMSLARFSTNTNRKQTGKIGITDFAQGHLGDIVHIELPKVNAGVEKGKALV